MFHAHILLPLAHMFPHCFLTFDPYIHGFVREPNATHRGVGLTIDTRGLEVSSRTGVPAPVDFITTSYGSRVMATSHGAPLPVYSCRLLSSYGVSVRTIHINLAKSASSLPALLLPVFLLSMFSRVGYHMRVQTQHKL
jgi:hypothetical protein